MARFWMIKALATKTIPALPTGYELRTFAPGDEPALSRVYAVCDLGNETVDHVRLNLLGHPFFQPARLFVVERDHRVTATAAALTDVFNPGVSCLSLVAVLPEHRRLGVGSVLVAAAQQQALRDGFHFQCLLTDDWREPAIHFYLAKGYRPWVRDKSDRTRWETLLLRIGRADSLGLLE